ncbi:hypothetical protein AGLY_005131 [Aphis glycines]|uniref:Uncharacterized protein n=1 Tax=Aphis glycines TaxID=307491 RepID=A0A6G0TY56_APHGL|nr:hypothetical protein AGLY_005131 [Aphis glycines]
MNQDYLEVKSIFLVNLSTIANLMQKQFKATLYTNCLLEQLFQSNNQTIQPASLSNTFHNLPLNSLEDVVEMKNKLKDPVKLLKTMKVPKYSTRNRHYITKKEKGVWDFDNVFQEHDYFNSNSTVFDCVFKQCLDSLKPEYGQVIIPEAELVNLKTRGFLTHPSKNLYLLIQMIEVYFEKDTELSNILEETCEDFLVEILN